MKARAPADRLLPSGSLRCDPAHQPRSGGAPAASGVEPNVLAGVLIGLAIIALAAALRAGVPGWTALIVAMVLFSNDPNDGLAALAAGAGVWILLRYMLGSRT